MRRFLLACWMLLLAALPAAARTSPEIPGIAGAQRRFAVFLIEDHGAMREVVWDAAFTDQATAGFFNPTQRFAIRTTGTPGLVDLGCWDEAWPQGEGWRAGANVVNLVASPATNGFILTANGKSTWLPNLETYDGRGTPMATFRGAYLNWLLANRTTTPSIPAETRWERARRGILGVARELLTRPTGGEPIYRIAGIGTSDALLIPPGEGLSAAENAIQRMEPSNGGSMEFSLSRALETAEKVRLAGGCSPGIVFVVGDGITAFGTCGAAKPYASASNYAALQALSGQIAATKQAGVWTWDVEGPDAWTGALANPGFGLAFSGDAATPILNAIKAWKTSIGTAEPPAASPLTLGSDPVSPTNHTTVNLLITVDRPVATATLNGQAVILTGLTTPVPVTLVEGPNAFTVSVTDGCAKSTTASTTIVLDTQAPVLVWTTPPPSVTTATTAILAGTVDDPTAVLTLNGEPLAVTSGAFTATVPLVLGGNPVTVVATDPAGNATTLSAVIVRVLPPLVMTVTAPADGSTSTATSVAVSGSLSEPGAAVDVNGVAMTVSGTSFAGSVPLERGDNVLVFSAYLPDGRSASDVRTVKKPLGGAGVNGAPVVTILFPMDGHGTNVPSILVKGKVDDPTATVKLQGQDVPVDANGLFERTITSDAEGTRKIAATATNPYGTGETAVYVHFDWTPPVLTWIDPTPAAGARLTKALITAAVGVNEPVLADINGRMAPPEPQEGAFPFTVQTDLTLLEGMATLICTAADRAGNKTTITRPLAVGLTAPVITFDTPAFEGGTFRTVNPGVTLTGSVTAPDAVKPLTFQINGQSVVLDAASRFTFTLSLTSGSNAVHAEATNAFGQKGSAERSVVRVQADPDAAAPTIQIDSPLEGFSTGVPDLLVKGRVNKAGLKVKVNGVSTAVDPLTLHFVASVRLAAGPNTITATAVETDGRSASTAVRGTYVVPGSVHYIWTAPVAGARSARRMVAVSGQADLPGVSRLTVNGVPMGLTGSGATGAFAGEISLSAAGRNSLLLEVWTLAGEHFTERRDVIFEPVLPKVRLDAPVLARPGETIQLKASPEPGTNLVSADLSWNGRALAHVVAPWNAVEAVVPADAIPGARIPVEAVGIDDNGETVTVRTAVEVRAGGGALLVEAFDDRTGLPLVDGTATLEGGETRPLDASARTSFATYQPTTWIRINKTGYAPVWRSAALQVASASAVVDARPTLLNAGQDAGTAAFTGTFAGGSFELTLPSGALSAAGRVSLTPLTTQGLPALLPSGWSAVSAHWFQVETATLNAPGGSVKITASAGLPGSGLAWVRWDAPSKTWKVLATGLTSSQLDALALPVAGGYALVAADPGAATPPAAVLNEALKASEAAPWREGLKASGLVDPSVLPTSAAIAGARATAQFALDFDGGAPIPSGAVIQADLVESYVLVDQRLIEPEVRTSDAVASRFVLNVDAAGKPTLRVSAKGLDLELPVRMSRTFTVNELVEGLIRAAFYRDGLLVATGGGLIGPDGGSLSQDGITLTVPAGALTASTFARILPDAADQAVALWPELAGQGRVARSFQIELAGALSQGLSLSLTDLGTVSAGVQPILVQRRVVQGQRQILAVGAFAQSGSAWTLSLPAESNPILEGGAFAVLVPTQAWAWVTGTASMPTALAQAIQKTSGKALPRMASAVAGDQPLADAIVSANYLKAASGANGLFAVPAVPPATGPVRVNGVRWDLGVNGSLDAAVPSAGNALRLASVPFRILTAIPAEGAEVSVGASFSLVTTGPMDPATITAAKLLKGSVEVPLRRSLSMDGRTLLLIPERSLDPASAYSLVTEGLKGLSGEAAPALTRSFHTNAAPAPIEETADFSKIRLSYPDDSFNVTITIPEGAIPPRCGLSLEAPGMGSSYTGSMPANGAHTVALRASLGERLTITVQFPSGKTMTGFLSRYEGANGRVVIGIDGGRIEAADGSGAAVVMPFGAVEYPTEFQAFFNTERPADLDPDYATENIVGRIDLKASRQDVEFKVQPSYEFPAPANPNLATNRPEGMGPYSVYVSVDGWEADGSPAQYYELQDTARMVNGKLLSFGGIPDLEWEAWSATPIAAALKPAPGKAQASLEPVTKPTLAGLSSAASGEQMFGVQSAMAGNGGPVFVAGGVNRQFLKADGSVDREVPSPSAQIFAVPISSMNRTLKVAGRLVARTNVNGRYMFNSMMMEGLNTQILRLMAVDADYGVSAFTAGVPIAQYGVFGSWYQAPPMVLKITPQVLEDPIAPWGQLDTIQDGVLSGSELKAGDFSAQVLAYDLKDHTNLEVSMALDGVAPSRTAYGFSISGPATNPVGRWRVPFFAGEGVHILSAEVKDRAGNRTRLSKTIRALDLVSGIQTLTNPEIPPTFTVGLTGSQQSANPATALRVLFSEPVQNATAASIYLERKEGDLWVPEATTFRTDWLPDIQIPQPKTHIAYLIPLAKLRARGQFRVVVTSDVKDFDPSPTGGKPVQQPSFEFTVSGHGDPFGSIRLTDPTRMASIGNLVCAATEGNSKLALLKMGPSGLESMGTFGADGSTFLGQEIVAVKGFEGIVLPGWPRTGLLLVTTAPKPGDVDHQGVLWGFHLCSESAPPKLIFGVSLGVGSLGYTPTIDYRDGMMLAGRLTGSVQVYSLSKAIYGWGDRPAREATFLQGANQSSLVQPFYLSDPAYEWKDGTSSVQSIASHWGVAFGPNSTLVDGTSAVQAFVGSTRYWAQYRNQSLTGAPRIQIPFHPDRAYKIENPFVPDPDSVTIGASRNAPPGHLRAIPGVLPDGKSASSVVAWPRASVILQGVTATKDLMLALSGWQPELKNVDGTSAGKLGNSLIILDAGLPGAVEVGHWPLNPPFGSGVTYEILNRRISLDPLSRTCALGVANKAEGKLYWFLVDLQNPSNPKVFDIVAPEEGAGSYGELSYGRFLSSGTDGQLRAWTVSTGIPSPAPPDMLGRSNCDLLLTQGLLLADVLDGDSGLDPETIRVERVGDASTSTILSQCIWLKGSEDGKNFVDMPLRLKGPVKHLFLRLTGLPQGTYKLRIWIADRAGNPEMEQNLDAIQNGLSIERTLTFGGDIQ